MTSKENTDPVKGESEVEGQKDKKFLIRRKILIPMTNGTNPANEEEDEDAVKPKPGKKMWKTFKRQSTTEEDSTVGGETAEDKKKKFRDRQGSVEAAVESDSGNAPAKARRKKLGELGKSISVEDLIDLSEEEREKRSWKEKADAKVANKKNKMLVKTKKQWKSYEKEPGQLNYDKYYKMKEEHKEKMKKRRLSQEGVDKLDPDKMGEFENKSFDDDGEQRKSKEGKGGNTEQNGLDTNEDGIRKQRSMSDSSEDSNESNTDANYLDAGKRFSVDFSGGLSIEEHPLEDHAAQKNLATLPPADKAKDEPVKKVNEEVEKKNDIAAEQSFKEATDLQVGEKKGKEQSSEKLDEINDVAVKGSGKEKASTEGKEKSSEKEEASKEKKEKGSENEKASKEGKEKGSEKEKASKEEKEKSSEKEKASNEEKKKGSEKEKASKEEMETASEKEKASKKEKGKDSEIEKENNIKTTSKDEDKQFKDENSLNVSDQSKPAIELPTEIPYNAPRRLSLRERLEKKESQEKGNGNGETIKQEPIIIKPKKLVEKVKEPVPKKEDVAPKEQEIISAKTEKNLKNEATVNNEDKSKLEESTDILDGKAKAAESGKEKENKSSPIKEDIVEATSERRVETEVPLVETNTEQEIKDKKSKGNLEVKKESKNDGSKEPESKKATPPTTQNSGESAKDTQEDIAIQKEKLAKEKDAQIADAKKDKAKGNVTDTIKSKKEIKKEPALTGKSQIGEAMDNKKQQNNKPSEDKQKSQSTKETEKNKLKSKQAPQPMKKEKVTITNDKPKKLPNGSDSKRGRPWGKPPPPANPINCFTNTNYDVKKKFLDTIDIDAPEINETALTVYRKYHYEKEEEGCTIEDVEEENEEIQGSMDEMNRMNGVVSRNKEVWHIFAAGKQTIDRAQPSKRFVPINRISDFELKSDKSSPTNNEKWLLVVRGGDKNLPSNDEFVEDLDDTNWFSVIQGTGVNVDKPKFLKKTLCWEAEKQLGDAADRLLWDTDNIPIPSNEVVHFGHHKGMFQKVEREKHTSRKLIKARKLNHDAYCITNVAKEIQNASDYFQPIMRKVHM